MSPIDVVISWYQKRIDSDPAYNEIFLRTKIKFHDNEVTDVYNKKILRLALTILV